MSGNGRNKRVHGRIQRRGNKGAIKSSSQNKPEISKNKLTESILKDFLSECFINPYEAIKRVSARKERINSLKKENPKITEDELKAILTDILLHFTFRSKFLEYIQKFIKTRYNTETIANYKIDSKLLLKTFRNNK